MMTESIKSRKWSEEAVSYFINIYKRHECLWNVKKASYNNKILREAAFKDISEKMSEHHNFHGLESLEIQVKFFNLKASFYRVSKKYKYSSFSPAGRVKWFKDMEHIVKHSRLNEKNSKKNTTLKPEVFTNCDNSPISIDIEDLSSSSDTTNTNHKQDNTMYNSNVELMQEETYQVVKKDKIPMISSVKLQSRIEINNVLKKLYKEKVAPHLGIMFDILTKIIQNDDKCLISSMAGFQTEMTKLGYLYKETIDGKKIIVENAEQRFERYLYLTKIKKVRARLNKTIVYIDERVINDKHKYEKLYYQKDGLPAGSSIFYHAITRDGLCHGLFSNQATEDDFNKWVTDILLVCLKAPCVIIMDNGPIHGKLEDTCLVTRYSAKTEMIKWLSNNNIPCSANLSRPELFELIRKNKTDTREYKIDRIIRSHGHEVLRLPNSFPDLNMTDVLWNAIAEGNSTNIMAKTKNGTLQTLQNTIIEAILPSISGRKWNDLEKALVMKEKDIYEIDTTIENILDTYTFM